MGRCGWVNRGALLALALTAAFALTGCATTTVVAATPSVATAPADEDDFSQLIAQLRSDLNRNLKRESERRPSATAAPKSAKARDNEFAEKAKALFAGISRSSMLMPVVGVRSFDLDDSWGAPRDGGKRPHRGIDIFAPRGTAIVAVTDGVISYIGDQPKGGHCLWLTTEAGVSFYYAHLDRWAPGLYEGMEVFSGDLLGFVGNTGNAITTPPHLHFAINENDEMVNPYPVLKRAAPVKQAAKRSPLGTGYGTR